MKTLTCFFLLLTLVSCNDSLRSRRGLVPSDLGSTTDALTNCDFRKIYIAEVTTPVTVGQNKIILEGSVENTDHDEELSCDLEVAANKQFEYSIQNGKLILKDGISTLVLTRDFDTGSDDLLGTWVMQNTLGKVLTVTELTFRGMGDVRITKTCYLK